MNDTLKQIKNWFIFSLVVIVMLWWFVYATDILHVNNWETLTSSKFNELIDKINTNSSKWWISILNQPVYVAWTSNWQASSPVVTFDLNTLSWVTVPTWATSAILSWYISAYWSANTDYSIRINWLVLAAQNWQNSWNKIDNSLWFFKLNWTSIDYQFLKWDTSWWWYFNVVWFVIN